MRGLAAGQRERLAPTQTDLLIQVSWSSRGEALSDIDLLCVLLDNQGRVIEVVDFNNPVDRNRAVAHGGDAFSADDAAAKAEHLFLDTRRLGPRVAAAALCASQFAGTFGGSLLGTLELKVQQLHFVDSAAPGEAPAAWDKRALRAMTGIFCSSLRRELSKPRADDSVLTDELEVPTARICVLTSTQFGRFWRGGEVVCSPTGISTRPYE